MTLKTINAEFVKEQINLHKSRAGKEPGYDMIVLLGEKCLELLNQDKKRFDDLNKKGVDAINQCKELAIELKRERNISDLLLRMNENERY